MNGFLNGPQNYSSWIPTVTGKLSYTVIGRTDWPRGCQYLNQLNGTDDCLALFVQERFCHDFLTPFIGLTDRQKEFLFSRSFFGWRKPTVGRHYFVAIVSKGEVTAQGDLDKILGKMFVIPGTPTGRQNYKDICGWIGLHKGMKVTRKQISDILDKVNIQSPLRVAFELSRNGEFHIQQEVINGVEDFGTIGDNEAHRYTEQMFYFFRDIVHNHQHHSAENDRIVRLHNDAHGNWKDKVYFDLFRRVIAFKRVRTDFHVTNATGILAYARTFNCLFSPPMASNHYYEDHTVQSLETSKYELQLQQLRKSNLIGTLQAMFFGVGALLFALLALANLAPKNQEAKISQNLIVIAEYVSLYPANVLSFLFFFCLFVTKLLGYSRPERKEFVKDAQRVLNYYRKSVSVLAQFLAGVIFAGAAGLLLYLVN